MGGNKKTRPAWPARVAFPSGLDGSLGYDPPIDSQGLRGAGVRHIMVAMALAMAPGMGMDVMAKPLGGRSFGESETRRVRVGMSISSLEIGQILKDPESKVDFAERCVHLDALELMSQFTPDLPGYGDPFLDRMVPAFLGGFAHPAQDGVGDLNSRDLVGQEFRIPRGDQGPDTSRYGNAEVSPIQLFQKRLQLGHVEYGLGDGELGSGIHLPVESLELPF